MFRYQQPPSPERPPEPSPMSGLRRVAVRLPVSKPRLTYLLMGINVLIFLYYFSLPTGAEQYQFLFDWGKVNAQIQAGEYYRLFTSMFLHLNVMHIFFNMYALYILGNDVEALFGTPRFAIVYFLGGLSGSLASFIFTNALSVGASGAIFAVFGADMVYFYHHRTLHGEAGRRHLNQLLILMVINLGLGLFTATGAANNFRIDNAAHIGGLVGGVVLAWFIAPDYNVERDPEAEGGLSVVDKNPVTRWVLPSALYAAALVVVMVYAVSA
jgi:rhomboid protease GluP